MMVNVAANHAILNECYGSFKGCHAIQVLLEGVIVADIAWQHCICLSLVCWTDALKCYNNVGSPPGFPPSPANVWVSLAPPWKL